MFSYAFTYPTECRQTYIEIACSAFVVCHMIICWSPVRLAPVEPIQVFSFDRDAQRQCYRIAYPAQYGALLSIMPFSDDSHTGDDARWTREPKCSQCVCVCACTCMLSMVACEFSLISPCDSPGYYPYSIFLVFHLAIFVRPRPLSLSVASSLAAIPFAPTIFGFHCVALPQYQRYLWDMQNGNTASTIESHPMWTIRMAIGARAPIILCECDPIGNAIN